MSENTTGKFVFEEDYKSLFKWTEYLIFAALLAVSMGIGIFYGFFYKKNKTNEEFLMAGRTMTVFPVALSLICSFISAVTLLGNPVEVYYYGSVYIYFSISFIPMTLAVAYLYVPVFFQLQLTSAYEYLEVRFSKTTRRIMSVSAIIHLMIYMPLTVWGPSLALDQVAGVNSYISSAVIFIVCVIYSSIGGMKAILWTDVLQGIIMFGSMITVIVVGLVQIGGFGVLWSRVTDSGRANFAVFDTDLRTRHTFWTGLIGAYFSWIPLFAGTQAQIQRYLSVPTIKDARKCLFYNMLGLFAVVFLCSLTGLLIFAKYYDCDPVSAVSPLGTKIVSASDQILPFFVMDVLGKYPTLPGILLAGLTSGTLSSVSSSLNALPAIIVEDYIKPAKPHLSPVRLGFISKIISAVGGMLSFTLIFAIAAVGNILPFASLLHGTFIGPIVGLFSLGMFFPWTNALGSTLALIPSIAMTLFFGLGSILKNNAGELPDQRLHVRTDGCYVNETITTSFDSALYSAKQNVAWKDETYPPLTEVLSISYLWQPLITIVSTVVFGLLFSVVINVFKKPPKVKAKYMTPIILSIWKKIYSEKRLNYWIDFSDDDVVDVHVSNDVGRNSITSDISNKGKKL
ncbi:Sodium-coupled monocarboxylate transporter 1 [Pseudolycoriella hygida]|uniref:Sodium-coupled monocarboxylate transporter 1 n=1 Tax=Pseudolycoriella hygida TaxID=35572 RepID=A0A9Q0S528_9DIPT|nr:Sodium-coupled monocarboxylate transporter 1 [Pseudolycoriella hygida]